MYLNYKGIARILSTFYMIISTVLAVPAIISIIYGEKECALVFIKLALPLLLISFTASRLLKNASVSFKIRDAFLIVVAAWLSATLIGSLPFMISGACSSFTDAFFESVSGFTTTGSTIFSDVESLPKGILFWRCFTHWLGGLGILFMLIALFPALGFDGQTIARAELTGPTFSKIVPKMANNSRILFTIYISLTLIETILLLLGGMSLFDAVTHSFSTMGTGGMSNYNDSIIHFHSQYIESVIMIFMLLSSINYNLYYLAFIHGISEFFKDIELRTYLCIVGFIVFASMAYVYLDGTYASIGQAFRYSSFNAVSLITTTGFSNADYDLWATFPKMLFLTSLFIGGCTSSTSGGIKIARLIAVFKMIKKNLTLALHPNAVSKVKMDGEVLSLDTVQSIGGYIFAYIFFVLASTLLLTFTGCGATTSLSAVAASVANAGPGFDAAGPAMNYGTFPSPAKIILSGVMLCGRLEYFTMFMMFSKHFWDPDR